MHEGFLCECMPFPASSAAAPFPDPFAARGWCDASCRASQVSARGIEVR